MARPSRPWYRAGKGTWYCTQDGRKVSLRVKGQENEAEALRAWHRLCANGTPDPTPSPGPKATPKPTEPKAEGVSVGEVLTAFLADTEGRVRAKTMRAYRYFLLPFADTHGHGPADALTPTLAEAYSRKPAWKSQTRHGFLSTLMTAFRWAERARMIDRNPLVGLRKPPKASRGTEALLTPEEYSRLSDAATPSFRLFLRVLYASGARPGEVAAITAENFDADSGLVRLAEHKTAYRGKSRVLYLPPEAVALLARQRESYRSGALLRNSRGEVWTENAVGLAMRRTRERAGIPHAIAYGFRHLFATDALANGVPDAQVAELLGHAGTAMLHKHYAHLTARAQVLRGALARVRGGGGGEGNDSPASAPPATQDGGATR
jgi:integrase